MVVCRGCGSTDGEECERFWSFLNRFALSTKEMSAQNRQETLDDVICQFNQMKLGKCAEAIYKRFVKACTVGKNLLQSLMDERPPEKTLDSFLDSIRELYQDERTAIQRREATRAANNSNSGLVEKAFNTVQFHCLQLRYYNRLCERGSLQRKISCFHILVDMVSEDGCFLIAGTKTYQALLTQTSKEKKTVETALSRLLNEYCGKRRRTIQINQCVSTAIFHQTQTMKTKRIKNNPFYQVMDAFFPSH